MFLNITPFLVFPLSNTGDPNQNVFETNNLCNTHINVYGCNQLHPKIIDSTVRCYWKPWKTEWPLVVWAFFQEKVITPWKFFWGKVPHFLGDLHPFPLIYFGWIFRKIPIISKLKTHHFFKKSSIYGGTSNLFLKKMKKKFPHKMGEDNILTQNYIF